MAEDIYRAFYTNNSYITDYMVNILTPRETDLILEPCAGEGAFIDALLKYNSNLDIDACDLNSNSVKALKAKYEHKNLNIWETDTLVDNKFDTYSETGYYDVIIGNPPYGAWQDYSHRNLLKSKYDGFHVKESYTLFLLRCISLLKDCGRLSFIIPDTFLFLHNHTKLRNYLLKNTQIEEIVIFPSKFFPGVNFGYSNLCIITLKRCFNSDYSLSNTFRIIRGLTKVEDLQRIGNHVDISDLEILSFTQESILSNSHHAFILNNGGYADLINTTTTTLGNYADCVTGIYTGNNTKYIAVKDYNVKNSKNYPIVPPDKICSYTHSLSGLDDEKYYIPFIKSSSPTKYVRTSTDWYINWSTDAINHYNNDKKARFQNSSFYFRKGIALPMVKSSKINATMMENMVFDQSIVGIFPKNDDDFLFLLGFLNSDVANDLIHLINPTANNSANYLKKLPIIMPNDKIRVEINTLVNGIINNNEDNHQKLNTIFNSIYEQDK